MTVTVTVVVPTWQRTELLTRCLPSIRAQTYPFVTEVIVVSDGPDENLKWNLELAYSNAGAGLRYVWLPEHPAGFRSGNELRHKAVDIATGEWCAFLDDDDMWHPDHLATVLAGLNCITGVRFGYGQAVMHTASGDVTIGSFPPKLGGITTSAIVVQTELVRRHNWGIENRTGDWEVVQRWLNAGATCVMASTPTVEIWPASLGVKP